jgi:hypothetical protein
VRDLGLVNNCVIRRAAFGQDQTGSALWPFLDDEKTKDTARLGYSTLGINPDISLYFLSLSETYGLPILTTLL